MVRYRVEFAGGLNGRGEGDGVVRHVNSMLGKPIQQMEEEAIQEIRYIAGEERQNVVAK